MTSRFILNREADFLFLFGTVLLVCLLTAIWLFSYLFTKARALSVILFCAHRSINLFAGLLYLLLDDQRLKLTNTHLICCVGCIHDRVPSGSSFNDVIPPRFWLRSLPGGKPNIKLLLRGPDDGYNFRPHSSSRVGHGDAELKQPGTGSSERSFKPLSKTWSQK